MVAMGGDMCQRPSDTSSAKLVRTPLEWMRKLRRFFPVPAMAKSGQCKRKMGEQSCKIYVWPQYR